MDRPDWHVQTYAEALALIRVLIKGKIVGWGVGNRYDHEDVTVLERNWQQITLWWHDTGRRQTISCERYY